MITQKQRERLGKAGWDFSKISKEGVYDYVDEKEIMGFLSMQSGVRITLYGSGVCWYVDVGYNNCSTSSADLTEALIQACEKVNGMKNKGGGKVKIITVKSCGECPHIRQNRFSYFCSKHKDVFDIKHTSRVHKDCPLTEDTYKAKAERLKGLDVTYEVGNHQERMKINELVRGHAELVERVNKLNKEQK